MKKQASGTWGCTSEKVETCRSRRAGMGLARSPHGAPPFSLFTTPQAHSLTFFFPCL